MKYKVVRDKFVHELIGSVNDEIGDGWIPQGGIASDGDRFYQAMVKSDRDNEKASTFALRYSR